MELSKVEAKALNAGDLPLTRGLSEVKEDTLLERCDFSGAADLPPYETGILLLGLYDVTYTYSI